MFFLWYLLIGLVAGWLANLIVKGRGSGLIVNLVVGIVGAAVKVALAFTMTGYLFFIYLMN